MTAIHAPWPAQAVENLNRRQDLPSFHPYTCAADGTGGSVKHSDSRILVAEHDGWHCRFGGCRYHQTWAHHTDIEGLLLPANGRSGAPDA